MTETQRRIRAYQKALPELRERVIAVALLLVMSASMLTSASFAWLTISRRPEVSGVSTTVAANGNLEIALATSATAPGDSEVGDSSAAEGQSITGSNVTWGNLVNLSDPSYGLEHLTLRPAQLNEASLTDSPLYGAVYAEDGRVVKLNSSFGYTTWEKGTEGMSDRFAVTDKMGVRAISSTQTSAEGPELKYEQLKESANSKNLAAVSKYINLKNNKGYMDSLATMMGLFMTVNMNGGQGDDLTNPTVEKDDIENLRDMYGVFLEAYALEAEAMAALADLQLYLIRTKDPNYVYTDFAPFYTADMIRQSTTASLKANGIQITGLDKLKKDWNTVQTDHAKLVELANASGDMKWVDTGIKGIVSHLANINTCTLDGTPIGSIGASNATGYLDGKAHNAVITNGILYNFEHITGAKLEVSGLEVSATVRRGPLTIPATVAANISTSAPHAENLFATDLKYADAQKTGFAGGEKVAQDTYGLAIDLWVRTNAEGSYLTLEGNVLTESKEIRATGRDPDNNEVELYTYAVTEEMEDGTTASFSTDVYKKVTKDENDADVTTWYNADTHATVDVGQDEPVAKMITLVTVIGYEGENRVWGNNDLMSTDATTQGSGSCYVYYADTPEDQARSMELLKSMNVVFIDGDGTLLATAEMDTERFYADSGRVTVPLVLQTDSINLGEDHQGKVTYAITQLEKNVPTRITAIVYLDGTELGNENVLSAADIHGQLNIQFGSSMEMQPIKNEPLENAIRSVTASVDRANFDYDTATEPMTTNVTVHVDGDQPNSVTAFFLRQINSTQGSREEVMTFTKTESGDWVSPYTFTVPGTYVMRTVQLDGIEYDLPANTAPKVIVTGFAVKSLSCDQAINRHVTVMTAANSTTVDLNLQFAAEDASKLPHSVQGRYLRDSDGSSITVDFTYNPTTQIWSGSATFRNSGDYTMEYLVLDGEYHYLEEDMIQTATVTLGMGVAVRTTSPTSFLFKGENMAANEQLLAMQVKIVDNAGNELPGLSNAKLTYSRGGVKNMDTDLEWNGSYYAGELRTLDGGPGVWKFSVVNVGGNALNYATTAPTFTIMSPEPPAFYGNKTTSDQFASSNTAQMSVQFTDAQAAAVRATLVKEDASGKVLGTYTVVDETASAGEVSGVEVQQFDFTIPRLLNGNVDNTSGTQEGRWRITKLELWNVFDETGKEYTQEDPLIFEEGEEGIGTITTKVVVKPVVSFGATDQGKTFGKTGETVNGAFMQSYTLSGLWVDIKDFEGEAMDISDVQLSYVYDNNSSTYGGYTSKSLTNAIADFTVNLVDDGTGKHFAQPEADAKTVQYAGSYALTFSFKIGETTQTYSGDNLPANAPKVSVYSVKPSAKITASKPNGSNATQITYSFGKYDYLKATPTFKADTNKTSTFSDYAATLYASATVDNGGDWGVGNRHGFFAEPSLTITVYSVPDGCTASLTLPASGSATAVTFERTGNGAITKEIGKVSTIKYFGAGDRHYLEGYAGHGTVSITTMTLLKNGVSYTVTLDNPLAITNPSSVDQLS